MREWRRAGEPAKPAGESEYTTIRHETRWVPIPNQPQFSAEELAAAGREMGRKSRQLLDDLIMAQLGLDPLSRRAIDAEFEVINHDRRDDDAAAPPLLALRAGDTDGVGGGTEPDGLPPLLPHPAAAE